MYIYAYVHTYIYTNITHIHIYTHTHTHTHTRMFAQPPKKTPGAPRYQISWANSSRQATPRRSTTRPPPHTHHPAPHSPNAPPGRSRYKFAKVSFLLVLLRKTSIKFFLPAATLARLCASCIILSPKYSVRVVWCCLQSLLATDFTLQTHNESDFWEILAHHLHSTPDSARAVLFFLKSLPATTCAM